MSLFLCHLTLFLSDLLPNENSANKVLSAQEWNILPIPVNNPSKEGLLAMLQLQFVPSDL